MGKLCILRFRILSLALLAFIGLSAGASELVTTLSTATEVLTNGQKLTIWLNILNPGNATEAFAVPRKLPATVVSGSQRVPFDLSLDADANTDTRQVAAGSFVRLPYVFIVPVQIEGRLHVMMTNPPHSSISLMVVAPKTPMFSPLPRPGTAEEKAVPEQPRIPFDANDYFRRHFFGYDQVYFIAGPESPTAKFQFSLRYRVLDVDDTGLGWVAQKLSYATNVYLAYTQVSLWDLLAPSSPFLDTSYKPEIHYWWRNITRQKDDSHWFHMDLQAGYQHESNGKQVPDSRSLNMLYLQPTVFLGDRNAFHASLGVRAWIYIMDLVDNPDIADYRGRFDVRAMVGWPDHVQLSVLGRAGDSFDHGSALLDLSYPLFGRSGRGLSMYLHAQYFVGYGESFLEYNRRSDAIRFGFSIYR